MLSIDTLWNAKMNTGIGWIDEHHKTLVRLMLEVKAAVDGKSEMEDTRSIIAALVSYSKYHFLAEERLMFENGFPHLDEQRAEHRWFSERVHEISISYNPDNPGAKEDLLGHLKDWFINHIITRDALLRQHIEQQQVARIPQSDALP
jgi:hemerythrin-like metal-binding protein